MRYFRPKYVCDRCGSEFIRKSYLKIRKRTRLQWDDVERDISVRYDLCDKCIEELKEFLRPIGQEESEEVRVVGFNIDEEPERRKV